uniref:Exportin(tRNA) n=1 Tax=Angiostrongylus cantonensis TaxID=6313 RepID=A0A158P7K5_ANGCA
MFSRLRQLSEEQRSEAIELHQLALLALSIHVMLKCELDGDIDKLGDFVMRKYQELVISTMANRNTSDVALPPSDRRSTIFLHLFRQEIIEMFSESSNLNHIRSFDRYFDCVEDTLFVIDQVRSGRKKRKVFVLNCFLDVVFENLEAVNDLDRIIREG